MTHLHPDSQWKRRRPPPGAAPGTFAFDPHASKTVVRLIAYGADQFEEKVVDNLEEIREYLGKWPVTWINVEGLGDRDTVMGISELLQLHPLALEDVIHVHQRSKTEHYGEQLFFVARMISLEQVLETEQVSFFLGPGYVLTFLEDPGDCFDPVRERLRKNRKQIRESGPDFLFYSLIDAVVDGCFPVIEAFGERLDQLEDTLLGNVHPRALHHLHDIKRELRVLRRAVWPLRESIHQLVRDSVHGISQETQLFLRDCYDHSVQIIDLVETYRELATDLSDVYISSLSMRMNEVMRVLTIIATIFMPLGFIAGMYGMNFNTQASSWNMPELNWKFGYPFALAIMVIVAGGMLLFFGRRGWLRSLVAPKRRRKQEMSSELED